MDPGKIAAINEIGVVELPKYYSDRANKS